MANNKNKNSFDYKGMMKDLVKYGFGGVRTSSLNGNSIQDVVNSLQIDE